MEGRIIHELKWGKGTEFQEWVRISWGKVHSPFCSYVGFLEVLWHQMHYGNSQFGKVNDMKTPLK
jgi:hypothetical protein